jgi:pilus assembly protein Flp/PilA
MTPRSILARTRRHEAGQGLAEYALILALIAIVAIVALTVLGGQISIILSTIGRSLQVGSPAPGRQRPAGRSSRQTEPGWGPVRP